MSEVKIKNILNKPLKKEYQVIVPYSLIDEKINQVVTNVKKNYKLDGFRQGQVPDNIIKQKYEASIMADESEKIINETSKKIVKDNPKLLNHQQVVGTLPLATIVKNNDPEQMKWMLNQGAKINATDSDGYSLLFFALEFQNTSMLEFLLSNGANPNCPNHESITPLIAAIANGRTKAAELLIKNGADLTWTDEGDTALTLAVSEGQLSVVSCILEHSTDRGTGLSAQLVQQARSNGQEDIALLLEQA